MTPTTTTRKFPHCSRHSLLKISRIYLVTPHYKCKCHYSSSTFCPTITSPTAPAPENHHNQEIKNFSRMGLIYLYNCTSSMTSCSSRTSASSLVGSYSTTSQSSPPQLNNNDTTSNPLSNTETKTNDSTTTTSPTSSPPYSLTPYHRTKLKKSEIPIMKVILEAFSRNHGTLLPAKEMLHLHEYFRREYGDGGVSNAQIGKWIAKAKRLVRQRPVLEEHRAFIRSFVARRSRGFMESVHQEKSGGMDHHRNQITAEEGRQDTSPSFREESHQQQSHHHNIPSHSTTASLNPHKLSIELERILPLSRKQIYTIVVNELRRMERVTIQERHRSKIRQQVEMFLKNGTIPLKSVSITKICDSLESEIPDMPRVQLYELVREEFRRRRKQPVTSTHLEVIREALMEHLHDGKWDQPMNLSLVTSQLSVLSNQHFPKRQLTALVQSEYLKLYRAQILTKQHREMIREKLEKLDTAMSIPQLCDMIEASFSQQGLHFLPRKLVYEIIVQEQERQHRQFVTAELKETIRDYVNKHTVKNADGVPFVQLPEDYLHELYMQLRIPRVLIYKLVQGEIQKKKRLQTS